MLKFIVVWGVLSTPVIAYIFARIWVLSGYLWCLNVYPEWLDRSIYSIARPYLSEDMVLAANQMEFLEVWIASAVILEIFFLLMIFSFRNRLK